MSTAAANLIALVYCRDHGRTWDDASESALITIAGNLIAGTYGKRIEAMKQYITVDITTSRTVGYVLASSLRSAQIRSSKKFGYDRFYRVYECEDMVTVDVRNPE